MDAPEKNLATKKPEDAQVETPETDAAEAEASAPALPEVPAYINQQRAEALRKNLESKVVPADKGLIYLAS